MDDNPSYHDQFQGIDEKLKQLGEEVFPTPEWLAPLKNLGPESTGDERLVVYQAVRPSGFLPEEAAFFLISHLIDEIATRDADGALRDYEERIEAIEQQHRLAEGELWPPGVAPAGYDELRKQYHEAWDRFFAQKLREFGELEMAQLFETDPERFETLTEAGRQFFFGPETADEVTPLLWIRNLVEEVANCMTANTPMGPLGYRYGCDEDLWLIDIYPKPVELVGGAVDGEVVSPSFSLDLDDLRSLFDEVRSMFWQSLGFPSDEGPHVAVEGVYQYREVFVQILAYAPEEEEPGMKFDTRPRRP